MSMADFTSNGNPGKTRLAPPVIRRTVCCRSDCIEWCKSGQSGSSAGWRQYLAADVAGYSRLMHHDEEATHAKLTALLPMT